MGNHRKHCGIDKDQFERIDTSWYDNNIEEPVRDLVKKLRNVGINTTCSCGHEMFIEGYYSIDEQMKIIHDTTYHFLCNKNLPLHYDLDIQLKVIDGCIFRSYFKLQFRKE